MNDSVIKAVTHLFGGAMSPGTMNKRGRGPLEGGWFGKIPLARTDGIGCRYEAKPEREAGFS